MLTNAISGERPVLVVVKCYQMLLVVKDRAGSGLVLTSAISGERPVLVVV